MKLGLIVRADNGGLGAQTWELYNHLKPHKTLVVDISGLNGYTNYFNRYPDAWRKTIGFPTNGDIDEFLDDLDVVMSVETPYNYYLFSAARERGIKSVLQYNYEFLDYLNQPEWPKPDLLLAPSLWHYQDVANRVGEWGCQLDYLHVPTNRKLFPFKRKTKAKRFLHIAGHPTYEDRNGTGLVLAAIPLVKADVQFTIRSQYELPEIAHDYRVTVERQDFKNYWEVYRDEDVLLLPRRYGGLSLQLNEALSSGMVPVMPAVSPQNTFLHPDTLIGATYGKTITTRTEFDIYSSTAEDLAAKIDWLAGLDDLSVYSDFSDIIATERSWDVMQPKYIERLEKLCAAE